MYFSFFYPSLNVSVFEYKEDFDPQKIELLLFAFVVTLFFQCSHEMDALPIHRLNAIMQMTYKNIHAILKIKIEAT